MFWCAMLYQGLYNTGCVMGKTKLKWNIQIKTIKMFINKIMAQKFHSSYFA